MTTLRASASSMFVAIALVAPAANALAQSGPRFWWGFDAGVYRPNSSEIRDVFGDTFFRVGFRPFENRVTKGWKFTVDLNVLSAKSGDDRLLAIPLTFGFARSFGKPDDASIPFVQVAAGPAYFDYSIEREVQVQGAQTERIADRRWGSNLNAEVGVLFNRRLSVSLRGDWYSKADDFDFSGVSLTLSYAAFRW